MEPFWERVFWLLLVTGIGACGLVFRSIIKPWSDAKLAEAKAFVGLVDTFRTAFPALVSKVEGLEVHAAQSNQALVKNSEMQSKNTESNDSLTKAVTKLTDAFGSDPFKLCRASETDFTTLRARLEEEGMTSEQIDRVIKRMEYRRNRDKIERSSAQEES